MPRGLRVLPPELAIPAVEIVAPDGKATTVVAATLDDEAARVLEARLRHLLVGCVVRIVRLPRVVVGAARPAVPLRA